MRIKNKIQITHVLFRGSNIWDPSISSVPQPYQVQNLGVGSKIKSSSHQIAHAYCSESLTLGTHLSAASLTYRNSNFMDMFENNSQVANNHAEENNST
jgi:hypothetical protein